jgi:tetratricopeptide (TPR) repeat protein
MKSADYKVCPACETRNRAKWDFCIRCGESLQGVAATRETVAAAAVEEEAPSAGSSRPLLTLGGVVVVALLGYWAVQAFRSTDAPERPNPGIFAMATVPPAPPSAAPAPAPGPGVKDFDEGRRLLAQGDAAGATRLLAQAVADAPENAAYRLMYAGALEANKMTEEALREYEKAALLSPTSQTGELARAFERAGRKADAIETYGKALELQPKDPALLRDAANLFLGEGQVDRALPLLREASAANPLDLAVRQYLGWAVEQKGDLTGAAEVYGQILEKLPDADVTRGRLAEVMLKQGQKEQAAQLMRAGIERNPQSPALHRGLAGVLERSGRDREAAAEYREYARLAPNAPDAQKFAARAEQLEKRATASPAASPAAKTPS